LLVNLALIVAYMTIWFVVARQRQRLDTVDSAWGGGFVVVAWSVMLQAPSARSLVIAVLVTIWGARLAYYLVRRSSRRDEDPRYKQMAKKWRGNYWLRAYISIFLLQGLLIWFIALPVSMAANDSSGGRGLAWLTIAGVLAWVMGFVVEVVADKQLSNFLSVKANKGKNMETGLWRYSRHPNYFGELVQWWAIGVIVLQVNWGWLGLAGPLLLSVLIVFVSGVPPIENKRRDNAEYQAYKRRTNMLIPLPPHKHFD
jgi:steroid 5-alpha reductase family enzyme